MKYRKFGKLDWQVSALGFGAMRLPILNEDYAKIDEAQAIPMIRYAVDHGVNYIDSAWGYHRGMSEVIVEKALRDGYHEKVKVATKLPCPDVQTAADFDRLLNEQLGRLNSKIDFYLLHGLNKIQWAKVRDLGVLKWAERQQADGRIGYLGFSFHDNFDVFKEIIDAYDNWMLAQIQYNFMDEKNQAGTKGLEYAHKKGLAVVVMEPIRGGRLARPPEKVVQLWQSAPVQRTPVEWALRWVWNHLEVSTVLSGMGSMQQVVENVASAEHSQPHNLTADEVVLVGRVKDAYFSNAVACTGCRYCVPCPNDVDIPRVFNLYNDAVIYGNAARPRRDYGRMKPEQRADNCTKCEQCVEKCPQQLAIPELLEKASIFLKGK
jgi:predicted aldo/keto reductase-like oxidoreductase